MEYTFSTPKNIEWDSFIEEVENAGFVIQNSADNFINGGKGTVVFTFANPLTNQEESNLGDIVDAHNGLNDYMSWKKQIIATDSGMPRYLEDLITDNPDFNIHEKMKTRYDEKVALRATQPKE